LRSRRAVVPAKATVENGKSRENRSQPAKTTVASLQNTRFCENGGLELHFLQVMRLKVAKVKNNL
jgi:hypothetical protein